MAKRKKQIYLLLVVLFVLIAAWFGRNTYRLYQEKQAAVKYLQNAEDNNLSNGDGGNADAAIVTWKGKQYERNPSIKAILCIGVDTSGEMEQQVTGDGGQADGLFLVAYDAAGDKVKVLMIPRDTMTPIILTDRSGKVLGKDMQHITLAYGYGDGRELSCERMAEAVSELLDGLQIDGYLAMNTSMIAELNDLVGGVAVKIDSEGMERRDPALFKGAELVLDGRQAEIFVRYRDINIDHSALTRMDRQKQYMEAYFQTMQERAAKDDQTIVKLMNMIEKQMITDLSKDQYLKIGKAVLYSDSKLGQDDIYTVPGEGVLGEFFDEFHHDPEGTKQLILDLFYREK